MTEPSLRKPVGALLILSLVGVWVGLFASLSDEIALLADPVQAVLYAVAGTVWIWVLPMRPILRWMETGRWR
jgi:hypothetical protein